MVDKIPILSDVFPDEGWTCDFCGNHNDDIYDDIYEGCGRDHNEDKDENED